MAATATNEPPLSTFAFAIEVDGVAVALFGEAQGLGSEIEVITHQVVNESGRQVTQQLPGHGAIGEITLMRGTAQGSTSLAEWINDAADGRVERARRNGSIVMFDPTGGEVARWNFTNGWPKSWTFDARTDRPMIVEVVLSYDVLTRG